MEDINKIILEKTQMNTQPEIIKFLLLSLNKMSGIKECVCIYIYIYIYIYIFHGMDTDIIVNRFSTVDCSQQDCHN